MTYTEPLLIGFLLVGVFGLLRCRRALGRTPPVLAAALVAVALISWEPAAWLFDRPLEKWYPPQPTPAGDAQAIVVLSASVMPARPESPEPLAGPRTYQRTMRAAWLYRHWRAVPVLATGGVVMRGTPAVAAVMREVLAAAGVPRDAIWTEERSQSTYENALYSAGILRTHGVRRVVLVTDAVHMLRSELCFRRQGIEVVPVPSETTRFPENLAAWIPGWNGLRQNEHTLHEYAGLLWYRLAGRI